LIKTNWPEDYKGQLLKFRSELLTLFLTFLLLLGGMILYMFYYNRELFVLIFVTLLSPILAYIIIWATPISPFRKQVFTPIKTKELNEEALKILTFLRSSNSKLSVLRTTFLTALICFLLVIIEWVIFKTNKPIDLQSLFNINNIGLILIITWWLTMVIGVTSYVFIINYILSKYDHIQSTYNPWPKDKPFDIKEITENK